MDLKWASKEAALSPFLKEFNIHQRDVLLFCALL